MTNYEVRFSSIVNLNPILTYSIDIFCLAFLGYFRWFKTTWSVQTRRDYYHSMTLLILSTVSIMIFAVTMWVKQTAFFADLLRPFILINFLGTLRQNFKDFFADLCGSITIIATVFGWIFIFACLGFYLFRYSFEGLVDFNSFTVSFASMLTLITTANFPDVMLPAYHKNYFAMLFFVIYLCVGLFFLLNLLLASVFSKFKARF